MYKGFKMCVKISIFYWQQSSCKLFLPNSLITRYTFEINVFDFCFVCGRGGKCNCR